MSFKTKIQDVVAISSANFVAAIAFGVFWFFLASMIEKSEYGEIGYLMSIANMGSAISILGLGAVILVYESKGENVFPISILLTLISSALAGIISILITQNFSVGFLIIGLTIFFVIQSGLTSKQKFRKYALHVLIRASTSLTFAIILYFFLDIEGILFGFFFGSLFILIELPNFLKNKKIEFSRLKPKITFIIQVWSNRLSDVLFWWGDKIIIGAMFGFSMLGSYYIATQYLLLMITIPRTLQQYLLPQEAREFKNKKIKIFSILIACLLFLLSFFIIPVGITLFLPQYEDSILPIQIMSIAIIPLTISSIQESEFLGRENSRIVLIGSFIQTGSYFLLIIILGQSFGLTGIAIGFLVSAIIRTIYNLITGQYTFPKK